MTEVASYTIRRANLDDSRFLYNLAMNPSVREMSTRSDEFSFDEHNLWYRQKLANPENRMWILEVDEVPVAQVRYGATLQVWREPKRVLNLAEIAISVSPLHRGKGYASTLLRETEPWAARDLEVRTLVALVVVGNVPSLILFRSAGYTEVGTEVRMGKRHVRFEKSV